MSDEQDKRIEELERRIRELEERPATVQPIVINPPWVQLWPTWPAIPYSPYPPYHPGGMAPPSYPIITW